MCVCIKHMRINLFIHKVVFVFVYMYMYYILIYLSCDITKFKNK